MCFQRYPVSKIVHPHQITVICLKVHRLTRILNILLHKRPRSVVWLQISPKQSLANSRFIGGKSGQCHIQCLLKHLGSNFLFQYHGKSVHGREIPSLQRGIDNRGQIQLVPFSALRLFPVFLFYHTNNPLVGDAAPGSRLHYDSPI